MLMRFRGRKNYRQNREFLENAAFRSITIGLAMDLDKDIEAFGSSVEAPEKIRVTALVSVYNSKKFFLHCMQDLIKQTLYQRGECEILIIDSASEHNERELIEKDFGDLSNITYLRTKKREGLYQAWNRGLLVAAGEYLTNANSDDRHRADSFEILASALDSNPECALAYGDSIVTPEENEYFECCTVEKYLEYPDFDPIYQIHFGQCGPQPLWRSNMHAKYGPFATGFNVAGDYEWWLRLARHAPFVHVPELIGLYYHSLNSMEHRQRPRTDLETDVIRNFYAVQSNVELNNGKYPNRVEQPFYSRHVNRSEQNQPKFSLVISPDLRPELVSAISELSRFASGHRIEIIIPFAVEKSERDQLLALSDRLRIRICSHTTSKVPLLTLGCGALHAGTNSVGFLRTRLSEELDSLLRASEQVLRGESQVVIRAQGSLASQSPAEIFSSLVLAPCLISPFVKLANPLAMEQGLLAICEKVRQG